MASLTDRGEDGTEARRTLELIVAEAAAGRLSSIVSQVSCAARLIPANNLINYYSASRFDQVKTRGEALNSISAVRITRAAAPRDIGNA